MRNRDLFLVDTSVWIDLVRLGARSPLEPRVRELTLSGQLATTGIIQLEFLLGFTDPDAYARRRRLFNALPVIPTEERFWDQAAQLGSELGRMGLTIPSTDLLIATVAMAADAAVLHRDRHFDLIAQHAPLRVESYVG